METIRAITAINDEKRRVVTASGFQAIFKSTLISL
jgi:hypothetical protein